MGKRKRKSYGTCHVLKWFFLKEKNNNSNDELICIIKVKIKNKNDGSYKFECIF